MPEFNTTFTGLINVSDFDFVRGCNACAQLIPGAPENQYPVMAGEQGFEP